MGLFALPKNINLITRLWKAIFNSDPEKDDIFASPCLDQALYSPDGMKGGHSVSVQFIAPLLCSISRQ